MSFCFLRSTCSTFFTVLSTFCNCVYLIQTTIDRTLSNKPNSSVALVCKYKRARTLYLKANPMQCGTMASVDISSLGGSCGHFCVADIIGTLMPELRYNVVKFNSTGCLFNRGGTISRCLVMGHCQALVNEITNGKIIVRSQKIGVSPAGFFAIHTKSFESWLFLSFRRHFTTILEIHFEKTEQNGIEFRSNIKRKYGTENGPVLSNKPSLFEIQTIYLSAAKQIPGLCGMYVFINYEDLPFNHFLNMWPKINEEGHTIFDIHELNSTSFRQTELSEYFSGTKDTPRTISAKATHGFYEFTFIVDERNKSSSLVSKPLDSVSGQNLAGHTIVGQGKDLRDHGRKQNLATVNEQNIANYNIDCSKR